MKRKFNVEISLSSEILHTIYYQKKKEKTTNKIVHVLCSQNIFLVLPRCPGHFVGFPLQESLFPFLSFPFVLTLYFRRKQRKHKSAEWHSDSRTSPLVPQRDIYTNIPPWSSFSASLKVGLAPVNTLCPQAGICRALVKQHQHLALGVSSPGYKSRVLCHWILVTENSPKQGKEKKEAVRSRFLLECIFLPVTQLLETRACGVQCFSSSSSVVFLQGWLSSVDTRTEIFPHKTVVSHPPTQMCIPGCLQVCCSRDNLISVSGLWAVKGVYSIPQHSVRGTCFPQHTSDSGESVFVTHTEGWSNLFSLGGDQSSCS